MDQAAGWASLALHARCKLLQRTAAGCGVGHSTSLASLQIVEIAALQFSRRSRSSPRNLFRRSLDTGGAVQRTYFAPIRGRTCRGHTLRVAAFTTTSKSEYQATCTSAHIALHAGAVPHQPGIPALAAHLALAVVRPGEPGLVQVALRAFRSAKTGARAPRFSARSRRRHGRGGRSGRKRVIAVKLPSQRFKSNEMPVAPDTQLAIFLD